DPKRRLRDIGDTRMELEEVLISPAQDGPAHEKSALMTRRVAIGALAGAAAGAAVVGVFGSAWRHRAAPRSLTRFRIPLPEGSGPEASWKKGVAIPPDGPQLAYPVSVPGLGTTPAANKFYLRSLSELEPKLVPAPGGTPFFSPDGHWLAFFGPGTPGTNQLRKIGLGGGAPVTLCTIGPFAGGTWADDDSIYFVGANPGGVTRIAASGGQPQEVSKIDFAKGERMHKYPCALPEGKTVLFTVSTAETESFDDARIVALNTQTGQKE